MADSVKGVEFRTFDSKIVLPLHSIRVEMQLEMLDKAPLLFFRLNLSFVC
jgi:hypothetical protein